MFAVVDIVLNVVLTVEPSAVIPPIAATDTNTPISPYSMAVAPLWSLKNLLNMVIA